MFWHLACVVQMQVVLSRPELGFRIGANVFCRLAVNLEVICKRQIAISRRHKLRTLKVGGSACTGTRPEWEKYPGTLESAQTSSADSVQACDSFTSVVSLAVIFKPLILVILEKKKKLAGQRFCRIVNNRTICRMNKLLVNSQVNRTRRENESQNLL